MKNFSLRRVPLISVLLANFVLILAVVYLMNTVQGMLRSDAQINLTEVVTQNKDTIKSRLLLEINNLQNLSRNMSDSLRGAETLSGETLHAALLDCLGNINPSAVSVAAADGIVHFSSGDAVDISGRQYFRLAMEGTQNISDKLISRHDGSDVFIFCVPVYAAGQIVGTLQHSYTVEEMYSMCATPIFSAQGTVSIINSEGYVVLRTTHQDSFELTDNYFRDLYAAGNHLASDQLRNDIHNRRSGFTETVVNGQKLFSAYTPIEDIHDWFLITSVPTSAVSPNGNRVIMVFYVVLLSVVLFFLLFMLYFLRTKRQQQAALEKIAFVDSVTGGNTYSYFQLTAQTILTDNPLQRFHLLKFDIDNFKYVNNFYGYSYGDKALCTIYERIAEQLGTNEMVARVASDHFVVLLTDVREERLHDLLTLSRPGDLIRIYVSAGLYEITDHGESINLMYDKAGTAARTVKNSPRHNLGVYSKAFDVEATRDEQLKRAIELALTNDEFIPYFQPKINVDTGALVGSEALARWCPEPGKLIPPFSFIPLSEKSGLVVDIDMIIFEKVLRFLRRQLDHGVHCTPISVNFSRLHLSSTGFLETLSQMLHAHNVPPHLIELELTESAIFENLDTMYDFVDQLRQRGFAIAMDDFGSGYSSLNMLKDIPIDVLKLDKEFLSETQDLTRRDIIFTAVADMAHKLDIRVVVEGVETLENVELMRRCNVSTAQGYYFSRPLPEDTFEKIFREGKLCENES